MQRDMEGGQGSSQQQQEEEGPERQPEPLVSRGDFGAPHTATAGGASWDHMKLSSGGGRDGEQKLHRKLRIMTVVVVSLSILSLVLFFVVLFQVSSGSSSHGLSPSPQPLRDLMKVETVRSHLVNLEMLAMQNGGNRALGTPGYKASVDYVLTVLQRDAPSLKVSTQSFNVMNYKELAPSTFSLASEGVVFSAGVDFNPLSYQGSGVVVDAGLSVVGELGCVEANYEALLPGTVALVSRGDCPFFQKADLAVKAGAVGVLIYNQGTTDNNKGLFSGTLGSAIPVPVFGLTYNLGMQLASKVGSAKVNMTSTTEISEVETWNIIAETPDGLEDRRIVVGSHLDGVAAGPGINDNGSGSSMNLALAVAIATGSFKVVNKVMFCWWGAEEEGLLGSQHFVQDAKTAGTLSKIALNLNFDMVGSPNYIWGIYNGAGATGPERPGSVVLQNLFADAFMAEKLPHVFVDFNGRSDYGPFIAEGIPAGGCETGADATKTTDWRKRFGGLANAILDPCYHKYCDTVDNINFTALEGVIHVVGTVVQKLMQVENLRSFLL